MTIVTIAVVTVVVVTFFSKKNFTPPKPMRFLRAAFRDLAMFYHHGNWQNIGIRQKFGTSLVGIELV